ncbi:MAG: hypothetical protein MZV63_58880 [Marinilabiliales bacterium]|nr:hypothetical protein [Marinilabiliales bacterium]
MAPLPSTTSPLIRPRPRSSWAGRAKAKLRRTKGTVARILMADSIKDRIILVS